MPDKIHQRHIGTVTYQGTEADLRAWGVWPEQPALPRADACSECGWPGGVWHTPDCPHWNTPETKRQIAAWRKGDL